MERNAKLTVSYDILAFVQRFSAIGISENGTTHYSGTAVSKEDPCTRENFAQYSVSFSCTKVNQQQGKGMARVGVMFMPTPGIGHLMSTVELGQASPQGS